MAIIKILSARCEEHGNIFPEGFSVPFSADSGVLKLLPLACGPCVENYGNEHAAIYPPDVESEIVDTPCLQHMAEVGHDPDAKPAYYPIWEVRPSAHTEDGDPIYRIGYRYVNGKLENRVADAIVS